MSVESAQVELAEKWARGLAHKHEHAPEFIGFASMTPEERKQAKRAYNRRKYLENIEESRPPEPDF